MVCVLACVVAALALQGTQAAPRPSRVDSVSKGGFAVVAPAAVFTQDPYMGVHCPSFELIACDEVDWRVWLRHPAVRVTATIAVSRWSWIGSGTSGA